MTPEEIAYIERVVYRLTLISDLIKLGVNADFLKEILPDKRMNVEALEKLIAGLIKLELDYPQRDNKE